MSRISILIIDDDPVMQNVMVDWLAEILEIDATIEAAMTITEAKQKISENFYDVILLDLNMGEIEGIQTFFLIKSISSPNTAIILITALEVPNWQELGAQGYIKKHCINKRPVREKLKIFFSLQSLNSCVRHVESLYHKMHMQG